MDIEQLRLYVVRPTLEYLAPEIPYSLEAENLLLATAMHESKLTHVRQLDGGPARGLWQIEPGTEHDNWENYIRFDSSLNDKMKSLSGHRSLDLTGNLPYQVAHARIKYFRDREPLPTSDDILAQARYWKRVYNTAEGKGSVVKFIRDYPMEIL